MNNILEWQVYMNELSDIVKKYLLPLKNNSENNEAKKVFENLKKYAKKNNIKVSVDSLCKKINTSKEIILAHDINNYFHGQNQNDKRDRVLDYGFLIILKEIENNKKKECRQENENCIVNVFDEDYYYEYKLQYRYFELNSSLNGLINKYEDENFTNYIKAFRLLTFTFLQLKPEEKFLISKLLEDILNIEIDAFGFAINCYTVNYYLEKQGRKLSSKEIKQELLKLGFKEEYYNVNIGINHLLNIEKGFESREIFNIQKKDEINDKKMFIEFMEKELLYNLEFEDMRKLAYVLSGLIDVIADANQSSDRPIFDKFDIDNMKLFSVIDKHTNPELASRVYRIPQKLANKYNVNIEVLENPFKIS